MKFWIDTEFIEDGKTIDLISIGIVAEDDRTFYAVNKECDFSKASEWVKENVLPHIYSDNALQLTKEELRVALLDFVTMPSKKYDNKVTFIGYYADYDWVVLCQLFGTMMDLPKEFPMYCQDIKQTCDDLGNPRLPRQQGLEHHALADAIWTKKAWNYLQSLKKHFKQNYDELFS